MKLNRKWFLVIALVLSLTMATAGTLAYLTDRDSEANVFTVGNVEIDLKEDFNHGATLIPGVDIEKKPTIENIGKNDAWVWATISIPAALDNDDASKNVVHFNYDKNFVGADKWTWTDANGWMVKDVTIDGVEYKEYTVLYQTILKPGDVTPAVMTKVYMDDHIDIDPDGNLNHVLGGEVTEIDWNINTDGNPVIYVSAYAMQTEGFDTVNAAYAAYQTQWGDKGSEYSKPLDADVTPVSTFTELKNAARNGGKVALTSDLYIDDKSEFFYGSYVCAVYNDMTLDLNGHSIIVDVEMETVDQAPVLFYVYAEGASLTVVGDGDVIAKNDAFLVFPRSVSEGAYIYGGNWYNNDDSSGTKGDINAIVYSQTNSNIHIYGGTFNFKNVNNHCGAFNVYDNRGAEIILYEGVLLSGRNYYLGSDADEIHLAEGCTLEEVTIDGETWYKVVKK